MKSSNNTVVGPRVVRLAWAPLALLGLLAAGCGSAAAPAATAAGLPVSLPLGTSVATSAATWAVVPMGVPRNSNLFWQLFVLRKGGSQWSLVTPPDVATNGSIAVSVTGAQSLVAGIRPSQRLRFSPVTSTANVGKNWQAGPPDPGLAEVPDALAAAPQGGQLLALGRNGQVEQGRSNWTTLTSLRGLSASSAARACAPGALTAVAFGPAGGAVLGASCTRRGVAGIFTKSGSHWSAVGPALTGASGTARVEVLRLVLTGGRLTALLRAGSGAGARLVAAWQAGDGRWTLSAPMPATGTVLSSSLGSSGAVAVELTGRRSEFLTGPGGTWQALPTLPRGRAVTLALPASGGVDALAADGNMLTAWQLHASGSALSAGQWTKTQTMKVPIQYGSSA